MKSKWFESQNFYDAKKKKVLVIYFHTNIARVKGEKIQMNSEIPPQNACSYF